MRALLVAAALAASAGPGHRPGCYIIVFRWAVMPAGRVVEVPGYKYLCPHARGHKRVGSRA